MIMHGHRNDDAGPKQHPANEESSKGADVGPVKHELALIVVLLLSRHTALCGKAGTKTAT